MPIQFKCPECRYSVEAPDGTYGKPADCPACGKSITIPESATLEIKPPRIGKPAAANPSTFLAIVGVGCFIICGVLAITFISSLVDAPPRYGSDAFTEEVRLLWRIHSLLILLCGMVAFYIGYRIYHDESKK